MSGEYSDNKRKLALFDFDRTLTRKDTLFDLLKYITGKFYYIHLMMLLPVLILHKMNLIPSGRAKEVLLTRILKGMPLREFQEICRSYTKERLPLILRKEAIEALNSLQEEGADVYVVSASAENWIAPWCADMGIGCIATRLEVISDRLTGKLSGKNCNGPEKVNRIKAEIDLSRYAGIYAFGDSKGDLPMLQLAGKNAYFRSFAIA